jgi:hypothetical protein
MMCRIMCLSDFGVNVRTNAPERHAFRFMTAK